MSEKIVHAHLDIQRGDIIRCKGRHPYEDIVDFMVAELPGREGFCLIVSSGYKAGLVLSMLPPASVPINNPGYAIARTWLIEHWHHWGYPDCPIDDVYLIPNVAPKNFHD